MVKLMFKGREKPFGAKRCSCPEAQAYWIESDRKLEADKAAREEYDRRMVIDQLFKQSLLPSRWRDRTFDAFEVTDENRQAYNAAKAYADNFSRETKDGLILSGKVGRGKTHLVAAVGMDLLSRGHSVIFGTVTGLLSQIRNTYSGSSRETEQMALKRLTRCQLLIIDDLGKEKVVDPKTPSEISWVEQTVYEIINTRYDDNKPFLITTNMNIFDLPKKYPNNGDAILSRLLEVCRGVPMDGPDWRTRGMRK